MTTVTAAPSVKPRRAWSVTRRGGGDAPEEVALEPGRIDCVSGSPKRQLNSSTRGPCGEHHPGESSPTNGVPRRASSSSTGRCTLSLLDSLLLVFPRRARTTHPARVGAFVAVGPPLEVLGRRQRNAVRARDEARRETSPPSSSSSMTIGPRTRRPPATARSSSSCVRHTNTPFPAASPSTLITHGGAGDGQRLRGRDAGRRHHLLREGLRALDPRCRGAGPEHGDPGAGARRRRRPRAEPPARSRRGRRRGSARARAGPRRPPPGPGGSSRAARSRGSRGACSS